MMDHDSPLSSFGKSAQKKSQPAEEKKSLDPKERDKKRREDDREVQKMLDRMDVMRREIEDRLEYIVRISGWTREQLWSYINKQENFSKDQWEIVQKENKAFVERVWSIVGPNFPSSRKSPKTTPASTPGGPPASKNPAKAKLIGSRRNWIQMR